ncbi:MAG: 26 kDa periplasmic immunogenic protein [Frankiales bacterium]|nr:26 kDa periplasmic immunogenic protein [Frankiales bacterium]
MDTNRRITVGATAFAAAAVLVAAYALGQSGAHAAPAVVGPSSVAPDNPRTPAITVSGIGKVSGTPDVLSLSLGVETREPDVSSAMDTASTAMRDVIAALRAAGVAEADLQTTSVSVQGNYRYDNNGTSHIDGYIATQQLTAKLRAAAKAGPVIGAAVAAGGDAIRLNGLSLSLDDDSALLAQARERAFAEARTKAEHYARLAGVPLGTVIAIDDAVVSGNDPVYGRQAMDYALAAGKASAPIQLGSQDVAVTVSVVYSIG